MSGSQELLAEISRLRAENERLDNENRKLQIELDSAADSLVMIVKKIDLLYDVVVSNG